MPVDTVEDRHIQTGSQLRALPRQERARLAEESLRDHLVDTAMFAHQLYMPLDAANREKLLCNTNLVRHPVRLAFELGTMASHQFAQPEPDPTGDGCVLYLHPLLKDRQHEITLAVLYFIPLMNYGDLITDEHCLIYGATVLGLTLTQYYEQLCTLAASIGAQPA